MTALHQAAQAGNLAQCQSLIDSGMDVNAQDNIQRTPLHWAAQFDHEVVCRHLVTQGADVDAQDNVQRTPLHWAAVYGHEAVCRILLAQGASLDAKNDADHTPIQGARAAPLAAQLAHWSVLRAGVAQAMRGNVEDAVSVILPVRFKGLHPLMDESGLEVWRNLRCIAKGFMDQPFRGTSGLKIPEVSRVVFSFLEPLLIASWPKMKIHLQAWAQLQAQPGYSDNDKHCITAECLRAAGMNMRALACDEVVDFAARYGLEAAVSSSDLSFGNTGNGRSSKKRKG